MRKTILAAIFFTSVFLIGSAHASLYDDLDTWKDFYNPAVGGVFDKYPALEYIAKIYPTTTIEITTNETVYVKVKNGKIKSISTDGEGNIELTTTPEIMNSLMAAKSFPEIRKRFYDNYDAKNIDINARRNQEQYQ